MAHLLSRAEALARRAEDARSLSPTRNRRATPCSGDADELADDTLECHAATDGGKAAGDGSERAISPLRARAGTLARRALSPTARPRHPAATAMTMVRESEVTGFFRRAGLERLGGVAALDDGDSANPWIAADVGTPALPPESMAPDGDADAARRRRERRRRVARFAAEVWLAFARSALLALRHHTRGRPRRALAWLRAHAAAARAGRRRAARATTLCDSASVRRGFRALCRHVGVVAEVRSTRTHHITSPLNRDD